MEILTIITCPHCATLVEIAEINCAIFRHGVYKSTMQQLPPHASKEECDRATEQNLIWGCGRPFRVINDTNFSATYQHDNKETSHYKAEICEYI